MNLNVKSISLYVFYAFVFLTAGLPVFAQSEGLDANSKDPLEITADGTLEWLRGEKKFVARKNALAAQGESSVAAQTLTALYRDGQGGKNMEIYEVTAESGVVLKSRDSTVYGDHAVYSLDDGLATVTGNELKMVSPDQTVTAQEKFEYWTTEGRVNALGRAKVVRPKLQGGGVDTLQADKISAVMKKNASGQHVLSTLEAVGNVVIVTPTETVTGAYGIYRAGTNKAELKGNVKIKRGPNILEGERAEVNLTTNVSTIYGGGASNGGTSGGRVRGVFYPGSTGGTP